MKEFGKRLLIVLSSPLWIVIHLIYFGFFIYILTPITYLIMSRELFGDWWTDSLYYSIEKHTNFVTKIERL